MIWYLPVLKAGLAGDAKDGVKGVRIFFSKISSLETTSSLEDGRITCSSAFWLRSSSDYKIQNKVVENSFKYFKEYLVVIKAFNGITTTWKIIFFELLFTFC